MPLAESCPPLAKLLRSLLMSQQLSAGLPPQSALVSEKINILLVDDHPANLMALDAVLREPNYNLLQASSGQEALDLMEKYRIALVLLDVQMPGMDGYETARQMKSIDKFKDIPIIFVSAVYTEDDYVRQGYAAGGLDYFGKPFNTDTLKLKVKIYSELYENNLSLRLKEKDVDKRDAELNAVLESIPDPIFVGNISGITRCNEAALDFFGFDKPEEIYQSFETLAERMKMRYPDTGTPVASQDQPFAHALKGEQFSAKLLVQNPKTKTDRVIKVAGGPIFFQGKIIGAVIVNSEISA